MAAATKMGAMSLGSMRARFNELVDLWNAKFSAAGAGITQVLTVATLPAATSVATGTTYIVTDATTPALGATVAGAGAVRCRVNSDGTNWKVG